MPIKLPGSTWVTNFNGKQWPCIIFPEDRIPRTFRKLKNLPQAYPVLIMGTYVFRWKSDSELADHVPSKSYAGHETSDMRSESDADPDTPLRKLAFKEACDYEELPYWEDLVAAKKGEQQARAERQKAKSHANTTKRKRPSQERTYDGRPAHSRFSELSIKQESYHDDRFDALPGPAIRGFGHGGFASMQRPQAFTKHAKYESAFPLQQRASKPAHGPGGATHYKETPIFQSRARQPMPCVIDLCSDGSDGKGREEEFQNGQPFHFNNNLKARCNVTKLKALAESRDDHGPWKNIDIKPKLGHIGVSHPRQDDAEPRPSNSPNRQEKALSSSEDTLSPETGKNDNKKDIQGLNDKVEKGTKGKRKRTTIDAGVSNRNRHEFRALPVISSKMKTTVSKHNGHEPSGRMNEMLVDELSPAARDGVGAGSNGPRDGVSGKRDLKGDAKHRTSAEKQVDKLTKVSFYVDAESDPIITIEGNMDMVKEHKHFMNNLGYGSDGPYVRSEQLDNLKESEFEPILEYMSQQDYTPHLVEGDFPGLRGVNSVDQHEKAALQAGGLFNRAKELEMPELIHLIHKKLRAQWPLAPDVLLMVTRLVFFLPDSKVRAESVLRKSIVEDIARRFHELVVGEGRLLSKVMRESEEITAAVGKALWEHPASAGRTDHE